MLGAPCGRRGLIDVFCALFLARLAGEAAFNDMMYDTQRSVYRLLLCYYGAGAAGFRGWDVSTGMNLIYPSTAPRQLV